jgi:hypothetical protein
MVMEGSSGKVALDSLREMMVISNLLAARRCFRAAEPTLPLAWT